MVLDDILTREYAEKDGQVIIWHGLDRRVMLYPCERNKQLNFVCICPIEGIETDDNLSREWHFTNMRKEGEEKAYI